MNKPYSPGEAAKDQTGRFVVQPNGRVRPLSPHLQVWRWHVTMLASILSRMTGGALYGGALVVAAWLLALAFGPEAYATFAAVAASQFGLLVWIGLSFSLFYHLAAGVRHLIWDAGAALTPSAANSLSWLSIGGSIAATVLFWAALFLTGRVAL